MLLDDGSLFPAPRPVVLVFAEAAMGVWGTLTGDWGVLPFRRRSVRYLKQMDFFLITQRPRTSRERKRQKNTY